MGLNLCSLKISKGYGLGLGWKTKMNLEVDDENRQSCTNIGNRKYYLLKKLHEYIRNGLD